MAELFEHGYGLVIGVDANQVVRLALPAVAKDVQAVYDVLVHPERCAYKPENVKLLQGAASTGKAVLDALYWLREKVRGDGEATAVIYYSGHGMVDTATGQYYLIPYDIRDLDRIRADAIRAETFAAEISDIPARRLLIVLDCCHAAGMGAKGGGETAVLPTSFPLDLPETKNIPAFTAEPGGKVASDLLEGEGRAILNSSTGAQSSYIRTDGKMSLFTYHLIEALTGYAPHPDDATVVYVTDVMSWVTHQVKKSAVAQGVSQTPMMRTSGVFPVAQLIGGRGVTKGQTPPDPLAALSEAAAIQAEGTVVLGAVQTGGGAFAGRDQRIQYSNVGDTIQTGNVATSAIGRQASNFYTQIQQGVGEAVPVYLFAPLLTEVARCDATAVVLVQQLQAEVARGEQADDKKMAGLIHNIAQSAPAAAGTLVRLFTDLSISRFTGSVTEFALSLIRTQHLD